MLYKWRLIMKEGFKRINFFKGFFTQAEDWQSAQEYHLEKRRIHYSFLHTPGIVYGCLDNLKVTAGEEGTSLYVAPGYAIDGEGHDLYLSKPEKVQIVPQNYNPPATVYAIIRYNEEKIDFRQNVANPEYSDYAFIKEYPVIEIATGEPDNNKVIELARIRLSKGATRIKNPEDTGNPGSNEIDMRYVRKAGAIKGPTRLEDLGEVVKEGEISVVASKDSIPSEDDTNVLIEKIEGEDAHRFYLTSAYPVEEAHILWRIESIFSKGDVEYRLFFKNLSKKAVKVLYRVYRLH
jgi:hypothetical protein